MCTITNPQADSLFLNVITASNISVLCHTLRSHQSPVILRKLLDATDCRFSISSLLFTNYPIMDDRRQYPVQHTIQTPHCEFLCGFLRAITGTHSLVQNHPSHQRIGQSRRGQNLVLFWWVRSVFQVLTQITKRTATTHSRCPLLSSLWSEDYIGVYCK